VPQKLLCPKDVFTYVVSGYGEGIAPLQATEGVLARKALVFVSDPLRLQFRVMQHGSSPLYLCFWELLT
jgi:hypothetical protein